MFYISKKIFILTLLVGTYLETLFGVKLPNNSDSKKNGYKIEIFKLQCINFTTQLVQLETCKIVAKRGTGGLLNIIVHYKGAKDIKMNMKFFYRGTSGQYQPSVIDIVLDPCDMLRYKNDNILLKRALVVIEEFDHNLKKGCPLVGPFNMTNFDINNLIGNAYPPVVAGEVLSKKINDFCVVYY